MPVEKLTTAKLLDDDGENLAVRAFLGLYGSHISVHIDEMRNHLARSGFENCWPDWAVAPNRDFLSKCGAQDWLRHLFALETRAE